MKNEILKYLSKYTPITEQLEKAITESTFIKVHKKGDILLKEYEPARECYFVIKGCVRSYLNKGGEEKTIEFYTEEQAINPPNIGQSTPSGIYLECLEDTIVSVGNPQQEKEAFEQYPILASLAREIGEKAMIQQQANFAQFKTSSPEERYLQLQQTRPDLFQRVSQYHIASYLGIKPESLSRIRKRILDKE